ncbi:MAG TPA: hypothetical protein PLQ29_03535 [Spirochaetales bacterium]|nr:hypothetical protein [Spirochaetales bacterium]
MKRTIMIVLAIAVALSMTACSALDALLSVNVFAPFAGVSSGAIEKATPDELITMSGSESFYETLAAKPELKETILKTIDKAMAEAPASSATYQELAVLGANIELQTSPAGDLINNIGGLFGSLASGDGGEGEDVDFGDMIAGLIPPEVKNADGSLDKEAFVAMIDALVAADAYYERLGAAISAGDVAQAALVSAIIAAIPTPVGYTTGQYLYDLQNDVPGTPEMAEFSMPDMTTGSLYNILAAAGLGELFASQTGE